MGRVIAVVVVVGLAVFAIWIWAQYNVVKHPDGYGLAGEVHPASGLATTIVPVDVRNCPSTFCGTVGRLDYGITVAVTGWAGMYSGKHGNCVHNEFQTGVWLRIMDGYASSGDTPYASWVPYACVDWDRQPGNT